MKGHVQDPGKGPPGPVGRRGRCCDGSWTRRVVVVGGEEEG